MLIPTTEKNVITVGCVLEMFKCYDCDIEPKNTICYWYIGNDNESSLLAILCGECKKQRSFDCIHELTILDEMSEKTMCVNCHAVVD